MRTNTDRFHYNAKTKIFACESSDLAPLSSFVWTRLFQDACDVGIFLTSHVTGQTIRYYLYDTTTDYEGDIQYWELRPVSADIRKFPAVANTKVIIYND